MRSLDWAIPFNNHTGGWTNFFCFDIWLKKCSYPWKNQIAPGNSVFLNQYPWKLLQMYYLEFSHVICMQGGPPRPSMQQGGKRELKCKKFFIVKIKKIDSSSIIKLKTYCYMYIPLQITHNHHPSPTKQNIKIFNKHHPPPAARKNRFTKILSSFKFTLISSIFPA